MFSPVTGLHFCPIGHKTHRTIAKCTNVYKTYQIGGNMTEEISHFFKKGTVFSSSHTSFSFIHRYSIFIFYHESPLILNYD